MRRWRCPAHTGAFIDANMPTGFDPVSVNASGDWTLTNLTGVTGPAVSEPPTILVLLAGVFLLAGWRFWTTGRDRAACCMAVP